MGLARLKMALLTTVILLLVAVAAIRPAAEGVAADPGDSRQATQAIPREPPRADLIGFGPLNGLGEATVTGAPGAVLPSAHVLVINLDSAHKDHVISEADGSFSAQIFAPPGSNVMVKHGPDHTFWHIDPWEGIELGSKGFLTVFPSTTIYRLPEHGAGPGELPFAAVGGIDIDSESITRAVGAAWSLNGTASPVDDLRPGGAITVEATIRLYSQAIISTTDVSTITLHMDERAPWLMLFDEAGQPLPYMNQAGSNRLTPTGFPILDRSRPQVWGDVQWQAGNWQFIGGHMIEGEFTASLSLDEGLPPGIYRPLLEFAFTGVPSSDAWRAALLSWMGGLPNFKYQSSAAALPPLAVGAPAGAGDRVPGSSHSGRLIWTLLMDYASLGLRGTGAFQDRAVFQPSSFVVNQGAPYVLPPVDAYSGQPASYRLEPYLPMIAYGRGMAPGPPLLPFLLPGGELCVTVHEPDGQQQALGCEPFAQSVSGDRTTELGELLNFGAIEVSEYYGLTTANEVFVVSFAQNGYHVIEMAGWVEDVWGNRYEGGGTYEVWVAHLIDVDPGLLPGTPLAVGDPINATVQLHPRLPAYVNLTVHHFPYSDPDLAQTHVIEGWANRFGHFAPGGPPLTLDEPGEYRLDLFAEYVDPQNGEAYAAAATWGGVVMTPPEQAQLVAHGRHGMVAGLADTFSFGLLLSGEREGEPVYQATTVTIQGDQVYVESGEDVVIISNLFLPAVLEGS